MKKNSLPEKRSWLVLKPTGPYGETSCSLFDEKGSQADSSKSYAHKRELKSLKVIRQTRRTKRILKVIADIIGLGHALTIVLPEGNSRGTQKTYPLQRESNAKANVPF